MDVVYGRREGTMGGMEKVRGDEIRFGKIPENNKNGANCLDPVENVVWQKGRKNTSRLGKELIKR
jgi:hypothetical protein